MTESSPELAKTVEVPQRRSSIWRQSLLALAAVGLIFIAATHWLQPDAFAAVTAIPPWSWLIAFVAIAALGMRHARRWQRAVFLLLVCMYLLFVVEQTRSLARLAWDWLPFDAPNAESFRVVSINCNVGSKLAAAEAARFEPDVVLLQESPNQEAVQALAATLFGEEGAVVWSTDCSIVARGSLQASDQQGRSFVQATWTRSDGRMVEIVCVRLSPPVVRYDLWSPDCWREHAAARRQHRQETKLIRSALASIPKGRPILLGGDCNCPAADGALREWLPLLEDAFKSAGRGWGATVLNRVPVLRFDQLWSSAELAPLGVWAVQSERSDHRLVTGEFEIPSSLEE